MFTTPRPNLYESSAGFFVEVLGRTGLAYREAGLRLASVSVLVNGTVSGQNVITERNLNQGIARVEVPVVLKQDNTITAKISGAPAGEILIVIMRR